MVKPQVIPYDVQGSGQERVLLLHHWFAGRSSFDGMRAHLDGDAYSYAFVDCRGYGEAIDTEGDFTMDEVAGDALAVADHLGWRTFSVLGHSMGGMAAQLMLLNAPSRIRSIIGVSPVPASGLPLVGEAWELFTGAEDNPGNRKAIIDSTTGGRHDDAWLDAMVSSSMGQSSPQAFRAYLDSWSRTDFHVRVQGNPARVFLIAGAHDPVMGAEALQDTWLRWYPNAELEVLEDAGHFAPEEAPRALATAVERALAGPD
ncbi:alpha/beta fold hydrolase [Streptomyces aureoversilis]|uniref:Alpha/beta fold hydrolase n=1 Tax=Streptomyces aureoversilis TaxID=67277 RepID=A0ABV9ZQ81_9ACTN